MSLEWSRAIEIFEGLCLSTDGGGSFELRPFCALQLAGCYDVVGRYDDAIEMIKKVKGFVVAKVNIQI